MNSYPVGVTVNVAIPIVDLNGAALTPTGLSYVVRNENDQEIVSATSVPITSGMTEAGIAIPADKNATAGLRTVDLSITTVDGVFNQEVVYLLRSRVRLTLAQNSFQTYAQAILIASDIPVNAMTAFWNATDEQRQTALIESFERLKRFNYEIPYPEYVDTQSILAEGIEARLTSDMWPLMTVELFNAYSERFRNDLRRAQVVQADDLLRDTRFSELHAAGVFSEKVGESSIMFRQGIGPIQRSACKAALAYLGRYIRQGATLTRV